MKLFFMSVLKTIYHRVLGQTFPTDPHYSLGPAWSVFLPLPPPEPNHNQVVIG